jgi:hypothetical protein
VAANQNRSSVVAYRERPVTQTDAGRLAMHLLERRPG